ncbi:hypothetical protein A9Q99_19340 [Gammaproteobacteria bacterium 45_16_T64]|nr:hypothetical protein A9Q99_19340 [Gammaproteobacteria bacterium 45_16_T64]
MKTVWQFSIRYLSVLIGAALLLPSTAYSAPPISSSSALSPHQLNGYISWRSDYVYRGVTLSQREPSLQASLQYTHASGLYLHTWASETKVKQANGPDYEVNTSLGYNHRLSLDWSTHCATTHYAFNGGRLGFDSEFYDYGCGINYQDRAQFTISYTDNSYGIRFYSTLYELRYVHPLSSSWSYITQMGHWDIRDFMGTSYEYIHTGLQYTDHQVSSYLTYHWASDNAVDIYDNDADPGWLAAISYHF